MSRSTAIFINILLRFISKFTGSLFFVLAPFIGISLSVNMSEAQLLIPLYLVGVGLSQFFLGPLADTYGQRSLLKFMLFTAGLGNICIAMGTSLEFVAVGVFFSGLGIGSIAGLGNTLIFAGYQSSGQAARVLSLTSILAIWAPALGMAVGIQAARVDWQILFWVVSAVCFLAFIAVHIKLTDPETKGTKKQKLGLFSTFKNNLSGYKTLVSNSSYFVTLLQMLSVGSGVTVFYVLAIPYLQLNYGMSSFYVTAFPFFMVAGNSVGRLFAAYAPGVVKIEGLSLIGIICCSFSTIAILTFANRIEILPVVRVLPMVLYTFGLGVMFCALRCKLMKLSDGYTATSESFVGLVMSLTGAAATYFCTFFTVGSLEILGKILFVLTFVTVGCHIVSYLMRILSSVNPDHSFELKTATPVIPKER